MSRLTTKTSRVVLLLRLRQTSQACRRGITSVLAMLFLVLFAVLAIGFFASTTMTAQISRNERVIHDAQLAAEAGLQFMRYQLGSMDIPAGTTQDQLWGRATSELGRLLNGTTNMGGNTVQSVNGVIAIPSATGWMSTDSGGRGKFRAYVTQSGTFLLLTVTGQSGETTVGRTVQVKYQQAPRASAIFDYGVASKGKIVTGGSSIIVGLGDPTRGSVLSTCMTDPTPVIIGGKEVSGDISIVNPVGNISILGASVGGTSNPVEMQAHLHKGVQTPDFPDIDTSAYAAYAVNPYVNGSKTLDNVTIPPNTNPKFNGNTTIKGVLYVRSPNVVEFGGNVTIQGCIVVENNAPLDLVKNQLNFTGSVDASGIETLPASYGDQRKLTGAFLLAKNFSVSFTGSFGTVGGHIIASKIGFTGNSGGIVKGSVINLENVQMNINGSADIIIASTGTTNYPTGVTFGVKYVPLGDTYLELAQ